MKKYLASKNLKLSQVVPTDIESRIYLNENLAPAAIKAKNLCRHLQKTKAIKSFRLIASIPAANITRCNGSRSFCNLEQLSALARESGEDNILIHRRFGRRSNAPQIVLNDTPTFGTPHLM